MLCWWVRCRPTHCPMALTGTWGLDVESLLDPEAAPGRGPPSTFCLRPQKGAGRHRGQVSLEPCCGAAGPYLHPLGWSRSWRAMRALGPPRPTGSGAQGRTPGPRGRRGGAPPPTSGTQGPVVAPPDPLILTLVLWAPSARRGLATVPFRRPRGSTVRFAGPPPAPPAWGPTDRPRSGWVLKCPRPWKRASCTVSA